jgi:hypothetical protein
MKSLKRMSYYREPDVVVRYESMEFDLPKVPYIANDPQAMEVVQSLSRNTHSYEDHLGELKRDPKNPRYTDYLSYYDGAGLDKVYQIYEKYFEKFGYQREFKPL